MNHDTPRRFTLLVAALSFFVASCAHRPSTAPRESNFSRNTAESSHIPPRDSSPPGPAAAVSSRADAPGGAISSPAAPPSPSSGVTSEPTSRATSRPTSSPATSPALPFESEIRAFEASDAQHFPAPGAIVFVGSSTIRLWKTLAADFHDLPVVNRGFGGSQVADSVRYADRIVLPYRPRAVVLYAGDNDLAAGKSPEQVAADVRAFAARVHAALPDVPILYLSIKPSVARWHLIDKIRKANALVEQFAIEDDHVDYVDTFTATLSPEGAARPDLLQSDGLHLNADGYKLWTPIVREHLERALAMPHI
jgi:lysophospholipase L1-like esterase